LQHYVQKQNETLCEYIQRWTTLHNMVENVTEHQAICAFKAGVRYHELNMKFSQTKTLNLSRAMQIANQYANGEEEDLLRTGKIRAGDTHQSEKKGKKHKCKADAGGSAEAAALARQGKNKGSQKQKKDWKGKNQVTQKSDILDQPCQIHTKKDEEGNLIFPKHTTHECRLLKQEMRQDSTGHKDEDDDDGSKGTSRYPNIENVLMIFVDVESKSHLKVINQKVNMVVPTITKYLDWAKTSVTFDQTDHPSHIPTPSGRPWWLT
jgi:hypothetical protein